MKLLRLVAVFAWLLLPAIASPQDPKPAALDRTTQEALDRLAAVLGEKRAQLAALPATDAAAKPLATELQELSWRFATLAARLDVQEFESPQHRQFDLQQEVEQMVRPLLQALKDATSGPRQISDLRARIRLLEQRQSIADAAARAVGRTRDALPIGSAARAESERELRDRWTPMIRGLHDELLVLHANLDRQQESTGSLVDNITAKSKDFVQTSGKSLLLATLTFLGIFFGLRLCVDLLLRRRGERGFTRRLVEVLLRTGIVLAAVFATLVVPWAREDFLLLAIGILFLLGAGWVLVRALPQLMEQFRLLLNVGGVREGERVLVDGLPFRITQLRFYTRLENPALQGGVLRVPLQFLVGKRSRPGAVDEPWFPCQVGDTVLLADGTFGPVRLQTPEQVEVDYFGARRSYPTAQFLVQTPRNLSLGFTVDATFALHRDHLAEITGLCAERLEPVLTAALTAVHPDAARSVRVQFQGVRGSGLELLALAKCDGAAAARFFELQRAMHGAFAQACQQHGWRLPALLPLATSS